MLLPIRTRSDSYQSLACTASTAGQFLVDASSIDPEKDVSALASVGNPNMEMTDRVRPNVKQDLSAIDLDLKALGQEFAGLQDYLRGFESGASTSPAAPYIDSTIAAMTDSTSRQGTDTMAAPGGVNTAPGFGAESSQDGTAGSVATVSGITYTRLA